LRFTSVRRTLVLEDHPYHRFENNDQDLSLFLTEINGCTAPTVDKLNERAKALHEKSISMPSKHRDGTDEPSNGKSTDNAKEEKKRKKELKKERKEKKKMKKDKKKRRREDESADAKLQKKSKQEKQRKTEASESTSSSPLMNFEYKFILAPMVGASELPFRLLCRKYGAHLAYTPMMSSTQFVSDANYRAAEFQTTPFDRPLVCHFSANTPEDFARAVELVQGQCDAVDLNLGWYVPPRIQLLLVFVGLFVFL